ncbi:MAG: hypothetical protein U0168_03330 [Nannocystaceae bacterium]
MPRARTFDRRAALDHLGRALVLAVLPACFSEHYTPGVTGGTGGSSGETGGCTPGAETCPCRDGGKCDAGLVCASQLCVDLGGLDGGADDSGGSGMLEGGGTAKPMEDSGGVGPGSDSGTAGETGVIGEPGSCIDHCGEGVPDMGGMCFCDTVCATMDDCCADYATACAGGCLLNADCAQDQVCSMAAGACVGAFEADYDIVVEQWQDETPVCWDGISDCYADVYYQVFYGGNLEFTSATVDDALQASWTDPWTTMLAPETVLSFTFWDHDSVGGDEFIVTECFLDPENACSPVGAATLHEGVASWQPEGDGFIVQVRFLPH